MASNLTTQVAFATLEQLEEVQFQIYLVIGVFTGLITTLFIFVLCLCLITRRHFITNKKLPLAPPVDKFFEFKQQQSADSTAGSVYSENVSNTSYQNGRKRPPPLRLNSLSSGLRSPTSSNSIYNGQNQSSYNY